MKTFLSILTVLLIIIWAICFFIFAFGQMIHLLLVLVLLMIILLYKIK
ncbi:DUF5670 family protein [Psychroserpens mesophilus]